MTRKQRKALGRKIWTDQPGLDVVHRDAAGIDIGSREHYVAVGPDRDLEPVQVFGCFTTELQRMAKWLKACGIKSVVMQSTGGVLDTGIRRVRAVRAGGVAGECAGHQESAGKEERCAGKPVAVEAAHLRNAKEIVPADGGDSGVADRLAGTGSV